MRRRDLIAALGGASTLPMAWPLAALAQLAERAHRVGVLVGTGGPLGQSVVAAWREGLAKLGWVEGRDLRIDYRFSGGEPRLLTVYAEELANLQPDVIFAISGPATRAVQRRTSVIPIVFAGGGDPPRSGLVGSIARPADNVTGFANLFTSLGGKWLQLFKEAVPRLTRVADIFSATEFGNTQNELRASIDAAAAQLGVTIVRMPLRNPEEIERAISGFAAEPDGGLLLTGAGPVANSEAVERIALYYRLPLMRGGGGGIDAGAGVLMAHGPDLPDLARRASSYIDRILRGAKPGDLPVEYPTKFQLVVNLKTAKAIGLTIPESFLLVADELIE